MNFKEWFYQNEVGLTGPPTRFGAAEQEISRQQVDLHDVLNKKLKELAPKQQTRTLTTKDMVDLSGIAQEAQTRIDAINKTLDQNFPRQAKSPHWENFVRQFTTWNNNLQALSQKVGQMQPTREYNPEFFVQALRNLVVNFLSQYARAA